MGETPDEDAKLLPKVTDEMRQTVRDILGEDLIKKHQDLDPKNLSPYWANNVPAYSLSLIEFVDLDSETWEDAWHAFIDQLKFYKDRI